MQYPPGWAQIGESVGSDRTRKPSRRDLYGHSAGHWQIAQRFVLLKADPAGRQRLRPRGRRRCDTAQGEQLRDVGGGRRGQGKGAPDVGQACAVVSAEQQGMWPVERAGEATDDEIDGLGDAWLQPSGAAGPVSAGGLLDYALDAEDCSLSVAGSADAPVSPMAAPATLQIVGAPIACPPSGKSIAAT